MIGTMTAQWDSDPQVIAPRAPVQWSHTVAATGDDSAVTIVRDGATAGHDLVRF